MSTSVRAGGASPPARTGDRQVAGVNECECSPRSDSVDDATAGASERTRAVLDARRSRGALDRRVWSRRGAGIDRTVEGSTGAPVFVTRLSCIVVVFPHLLVVVTRPRGAIVKRPGAPSFSWPGWARSGPVLGVPGRATGASAARRAVDRLMEGMMALRS
jgi:hypothetical protein